MPAVTVSLSEITQSVSRPVIIDIVTQIQALTKIDPNARIYFPGETVMAQPATTLGDTNHDPLLNSNQYLFIEATDYFDNQSLSSTATDYHEYGAVFSDGMLGLSICPFYATSVVEITFKYQSPSKTEVVRWHDDIRMRISQMRDINLHDVTYHYGLPKPYLDLLRHVHTLREAKAGYGNTFDEYLEANSTSRLKKISDLAGKDSKYVIGETQMRIVGTFGFDGSVPDKPEYDAGTGTWSIAFTYKFSYERPLSCGIQYPVMVHNQLLAPDYVNFVDNSYDLDKVQQSFSNSIGALNHFESQLQAEKYINLDPVIRIPEFDDFRPKHYHVGLGIVVQALCEIDETDHRTLLNLNELGDFCMDADILDFIKQSETPYITKLYGSIIHVSLYRNGNLTSPETLMIDELLNIKATQDLDLRNTHRVVFSLINDLTYLKSPAIARLMKYPKAFVKIVQAINELLRDHPKLSALGTKRELTQADFNGVYRFLTGIDYLTGRQSTEVGALFNDVDPRFLEAYRKGNMAFHTVQYSSVVALKQSA